MTKPVCYIILNFGILRHSWQTVKYLRRSKTGGEDNEKKMEKLSSNILQVWCVLAVHSVMISTGLESKVLSYLPLYFYFKMIALGLFFFLPSSRNINVPAQYVFQKVLVQSVNRVNYLTYKIHLEYHNITLKCQEQAWILPWRLLDLIFPGVLACSPLVDEQELYERRQMVWRRRAQQIGESRMRYPVSSRKVMSGEIKMDVVKEQSPDVEVQNETCEVESKNEGNTEGKNLAVQKTEEEASEIIIDETSEVPVPDDSDSNSSVDVDDRTSSLDSIQKYSTIPQPLHTNSEEEPSAETETSTQVTTCDSEVRSDAVATIQDSSVGRSDSSSKDDPATLLMSTYRDNQNNDSQDSDASMDSMKENNESKAKALLSSNVVVLSPKSTSKRKVTTTPSRKGRVSSLGNPRSPSSFNSPAANNRVRSSSLLLQHFSSVYNKVNGVKSITNDAAKRSPFPSPRQTKKSRASMDNTTKKFPQLRRRVKNPLNKRQTLQTPEDVILPHRRHNDMMTNDRMTA